MEKILGYDIKDLLTKEVNSERETAKERDGSYDKWDAENETALTMVANLRKNTKE